MKQNHAQIAMKILRSIPVKHVHDFVWFWLAIFTVVGGFLRYNLLLGMFQ